MRNRFDCVMGLLCNGANINIADQEGNTPLHLAVKSNLVPIIHALIVFEADVDYMYGNIKFIVKHISFKLIE